MSTKKGTTIAKKSTEKLSLNEKIRRVLKEGDFTPAEIAKKLGVETHKINKTSYGLVRGGFIRKSRTKPLKLSLNPDRVISVNLKKVPPVKTHSIPNFVIFYTLANNKLTYEVYKDQDEFKKAFTTIQALPSLKELKAFQPVETVSVLKLKI